MFYNGGKKSKLCILCLKSIIKEREVIRRGATWRIGDGHSILVWETTGYLEKLEHESYPLVGLKMQRLS